MGRTHAGQRADLERADARGGQPASLRIACLQVDKDGMLTVPEIRNARVTALEHGALTSPEAIVMHRTESSTAKSTLDGYNAGGQPAGAHFLIDKDGTIYQTASLTTRPGTWARSVRAAPRKAR